MDQKPTRSELVLMQVATTAIQLKVHSGRCVLPRSDQGTLKLSGEWPVADRRRGPSNDADDHMIMRSFNARYSRHDRSGQPA
jgi:hypothetical protein